MDFLQQANRELDGNLRTAEATNTEMKERVQELSSKNARICSELQEIGDLVKQMEAEREGSEENLRQTIAEVEVCRLQLNTTLDLGISHRKGIFIFRLREMA